MSTYPLSFCEVLEDECHYLFRCFDYAPVYFERKQIRELDDLARRLELAVKTKDESRWSVLAEAVARVRNESAPSAQPDYKQVIVDALNWMINGNPKDTASRGDEGLLHKLLTRDEDREGEKGERFKDQIADPEVWRMLMSIPVARRLLLVEEELLDVIAIDTDLITRFARCSAGVRLLLSEGMERAFRTYPALLSTIAENPGLDKLLVEGESAKERRKRLRECFAVKQRNRFVEWLRTHGPRRFRTKPGAEADRCLTMKSRSNAEISRLVSGDQSESLAQEQQISPNELASFNAILIETAYCAHITDHQKMRSLYAAIHQQKPGTAALCLSGGGIRSATFNLGILQGLADHRLLNRLHYLSTVSGGGYIGSWLSSWIRRHHEGVVGVAEDLSREPSDPLQPEVNPIRYLREYSAYLAPRAAAFSLDSWTLVATYLRNLLLNWTMLIPALAAALALPRLYGAIVCTAANTTPHWRSAMYAAFTLAIGGAAAIGVVRPATPFSGRGSNRHGIRATMSWLLPLIFSGLLFCVYWAQPGNYFFNYWWVLPVMFSAGSLLGAVFFAFHLAKKSQPFAIGVRAKLRQIKLFLLWLVRVDRFGTRGWIEVLFAVLSGAISGWLLRHTFTQLFTMRALEDQLRMELYICFGVPLYMMVFFIQVTLLVGFTTKWCRDYDREWWARVAAALFVYAAIHALVVFAVLLVPLLLYEMPEFLLPIGGASGMGAWLLSRLTKKTISPEKDLARGRWLMPSLRVAATVVLLFVVALISILSSHTLAWIDQRGFVLLSKLDWVRDFEALFQHGAVHPQHVRLANDASIAYLRVLRETHVATLIAFVLGTLALALIMSRAVNVNVYSMHGMYRNRLIRAYLGASRRERHPDSFTGFDPQDNVEMWKLRPQFIWPSSFLEFKSFADCLVKQAWWHNETIDTPQVEAGRTMLATYREASPEKKWLLEGTVRTAVSDAINELMRTRDLRNDIEVPCTLKLLEENRKYLEETFLSLRKRDNSPQLESKEVLRVPATRTSPDGSKMPSALADCCDTDPGDIRTIPPLHVLSTALNLVHGENLAWQERKAASFTISPLHAGSRILGYRDSAEYARASKLKAGISLGTAMAISGAAVSPNRGAASSSTFMFLMTLFNARLGWWLGNPKKAAYTADSPKRSLPSLLREALGRTDEDHDYVYLSDGGHFENLGLYEMVLRRCKYIIVCDATADGNFGFGELANAVRKVRIDMGIPIDPLITKHIGPQKDERYGRYCAFGHIRYQDVDGGGEENMGYLLYIKPCVFSECPADVRHYAKEHQTFPHETTVDQFFSESQFESYRALGRHIIGRICGDTVEKPACVAPNVPVFFANAWAYVHEAVPPAGNAKVESVSDVVQWMQLSLGQPRQPSKGHRNA